MKQLLRKEEKRIMMKKNLRIFLLLPNEKPMIFHQLIPMENILLVTTKEVIGVHMPYLNIITTQTHLLL